MQNYFGIALRSNVGNLAAIKLSCMASMRHICGYQDNSQKICRYMVLVSK